MKRTGFTLAEVLIALVIFALLAAAGTAVLATTIDGRFAVKAASDRTAELQRLRALLKADVGQMTARPTVGDRPVASGDGAVLILTRAGWSNPSGRPRPSLQRVEWRLVDDRLERRTFDQVAGGAPSPAQIAFDGVRDVQVTYLVLQQESPVFEPTNQRPTPDAVRMRMTLDHFGPVEFLLPTGAGR
jgi:general secretion pathway protein J